ncbi:MAG: hypothetical protein H5T45_02460 [Thermoplasmatales archaeon]|nr:hypothetical protein [Thermoplasmatales archaeon]
MKEELIDHILKNREMFYNKKNIQNYIEMIEKKVFIKNPFDRIIAILFELVIENEIDPLNVDLISFSNLYMEKVRGEEINLFVVGKIISMAWKILRLQSERVIESIEKKEVEIDVPDWYGDDEIFYYTQKVINDEIPLDSKIRRCPSVRVTIFDLINAFEEAREEIEKRGKNRKTVDNRTNNLSPPREHIHKEDIEEDIKKLMEKLSKLNGKAIPVKNLCSRKEDIVSILLPLLFLAKEGKIVIWQENFPFGEIYIRMKHGS